MRPAPDMDSALLALHTYGPMTVTELGARLRRTPRRGRQLARALADAHLACQTSRRPVVLTDRGVLRARQLCHLSITELDVLDSMSDGCGYTVRDLDDETGRSTSWAVLTMCSRGLVAPAGEVGDAVLYRITEAGREGMTLALSAGRTPGVD